MVDEDNLRLTANFYSRLRECSDLSFIVEMYLKHSLLVRMNLVIPADEKSAWSTYSSMRKYQRQKLLTVGRLKGQCSGIWHLASGVWPSCCALVGQEAEGRKGPDSVSSLGRGECIHFYNPFLQQWQFIHEDETMLTHHLPKGLVFQHCGAGD